MNRVLKRPMFRIGGSAGTGITSGLDRKPFQEGTDPTDRAQIIKSAGDITKETIADPTLRRLLLPRQRGLSPGTLPGFLTSFGLNLASATPTGTGFSGLAATAAKAAQTPFQTFQAAKLTDREDKAELARDLFTSAVASEYDVAVQKLKNQAKTGSDLSLAETERNIITNAQNEIFKQSDILNDENSTDEEKKAAQRAIIVQQKVLEKELGVPPEYNAIISSQELFDAEMENVVTSYNQEQELKRKEYIDANPGADPEEVLEMFPDIVSGSAKARSLTFEDLKKRFYYGDSKAEGGRIGYRMGSQPMMESVVEDKKQTGEVKDLSYTELRARLPQEISNDIVQLLANSKQALLDFANIQTGEDIASFNQQYDVNLTLPQGA